MYYDSDNAKRELENAKKRVQAGVRPHRNKKDILDFSDYCLAGGLSNRRVIKYISTLCTLNKRLKQEFRKVTRIDIQHLVEDIERSDYSEWTKHDFRVTLKKFYKWLRGTEEYPPEVKWIRTGCTRHPHKLPDELLTQEEVQAMIVAAKSSRDKAFIAILYESGCRIGELLSMQIKQLQHHQHGFQITVKSQKKPRRLLLIASAQYLSMWLNEHPMKSNPQAPMWITSDYRAKPITHNRVIDILKTTAKRAGVRKAVNPYNFRHSRATHLANHLTESQMKEYFGWVQGSDMASTYVHLSGRDIDNALLKINNIPIENDNNRNNDFTQKPCPRCKSNNPPANKYCSLCGMILDEETARIIVKKELHSEETDSIRERLIKDNEFMEMLLRKLGNMKRIKS